MAHAKLSSETIAAIQRMAQSTNPTTKKTYTQAEIAAALDLSLAAVNKYVHSVSTKGQVSQAEVVPAESILEKQARQAEEARQKKEVVEAVREVRFRNFLTELLTEIVEPIKPRPIQKPIASKHASERGILLHFSDWHYAEIVESESVFHLNQHNAAISAQRVFRVTQAFLHCVEELRFSGRYKLPKLTVLLNGDFVPGTIHNAEKHTDAANVVRSVVQCGGLIAMALSDLATQFEQVEVIGLTGNHGRLPDAKKPPTKDHTRSWDWMAYKFAEAHLSNQPNIKFVLPDSYGHFFDVGKAHCFAGHGHFVKQQLSIPALGVHRFAAGLGSTVSRTKDKRLDYVFFGHFHRGATVDSGGVRVFINDSLVGTQEYGLYHGGSVVQSAQWYHVFDNDLGIVQNCPLYGVGKGYEGAYEIPSWAK
jgi:predicted transcriptional regulator